MDLHDLTLTSADLPSRVHIGPNMRIYAATDAGSYGMHAFLVQVLQSDRLGETAWSEVNTQPSVRQINTLAMRLVSSSLQSVLRAYPKEWKLLAGPFNGYRVLVRRAGCIARLFGHPYEFVVERDAGTGSIERWQDADVSPVPLARLAFLLKRELARGAVDPSTGRRAAA